MAGLGQTAQAQVQATPKAQATPAVTPTAQVPNAAPQQVSYSNVNFDPSSFMTSLNNYLGPMFRSQQMGLDTSLADAGIVGGSTAGADQQLAAQQQTQEQGAASGDLLSLLNLNLNQNEFNAGAFNQYDLQKMGITGNLLAGGAGSQTPVYQQPSQVNLGGLGTGLGQALTPAPPATPSPTPWPLGWA